MLKKSAAANVPQCALRKVSQDIPREGAGRMPFIERIRLMVFRPIS